MENNHVTQFDAHFQHKLNIMTERGVMTDIRREGKVEEKLEIALKMLADGMSIENVCKYTDLTKQQIEQLKQ